MAADPRTDLERLEDALVDSIGILVRVVGLPQADGTPMPRVPASEEPLVDPDVVPAAAYRAVCHALEVLGFGLALACPTLDAPTTTIEEGLAYLTSRGAQSL